MTIYMVVSEKNRYMFDFILKDIYKTDEEKEQNCKMLIGDNLDITLIKNRTEFMNTFNYIIIDREAFVNGDRHIVQMIKSITSFIDKARTIFIWQDIDENIKQEIIDIGVKNLVINEDIREQQEEIRECFSENGMTRYNLNWKTINNDMQEKYNFRVDSIYGILFMSTYHNSKSISISLSLCKYLSKVGAKVNYIAPFYTDAMLAQLASIIGATEKQEIIDNTDNEENLENEEVTEEILEEDNMATKYETKEKEFYYKYENIILSKDFAYNIHNKELFNFVICDCGYIDEEKLENNIEQLNDENYDKKIVLCELNIIEIPVITEILEKLDKNTYLYYDNEEKDIKSLLTTELEKDFYNSIDKQLRIKKIEKQEDFIDTRTNRNFFYSLIEPNTI